MLLIQFDSKMTLRYRSVAKIHCRPTQHPSSDEDTDSRNSLNVPVKKDPKTLIDTDCGGGGNISACKWLLIKMNCKQELEILDGN